MANSSWRHHALRRLSHSCHMPAPTDALTSSSQDSSQKSQSTLHPCSRTVEQIVDVPVPQILEQKSLNQNANKWRNYRTSWLSVQCPTVGLRRRVLGWAAQRPHNDLLGSLVSEALSKMLCAGTPKYLLICSCESDPVVWSATAHSTHHQQIFEAKRCMVRVQVVTAHTPLALNIATSCSPEAFMYAEARATVITHTSTDHNPVQ